MEERELLQYALEHGMINVSYSEVFDEWNDRRLPICGDFLRYGRISMRYTRYSTANDVMKEFLIYGAELTEMGFPKLPAVNCYPSDSVDFQSSLSRSLKGHRKHPRPETISTTRLNARKSIFTACGIVLYTNATKTPLKAFYGLIIA